MLRISTFLEAIESLLMVLLDFVDIIVTGSFELNFHEDWIEARIVVDHVLLLPPAQYTHIQGLAENCAFFLTQYFPTVHVQ